MAARRGVGGRPGPVRVATAAVWGTSRRVAGAVPVVEQEEEGGRRDGQLQPPPVGQRERQPAEQHEPHREGRLVEDRHVSSGARAHELCD